MGKRAIILGLFLLLGGGMSESSPAQAVKQESLTLEVIDKNLDGLLYVRGHRLCTEKSRYPDELRFEEETVEVRLFAVENGRFDRGDVLVVLNRSHSVYDNQASHLLVDIIRQADLEDSALIEVARRNPEVPVLHLREAERLLKEGDYPYSDRGYSSLLEWEIYPEFTKLSPAGDSGDSANSGKSAEHIETAVYRLSFLPPTERIDAEWYLTIDIDRGTISDYLFFEGSPAPEPEPD
jgi:hypothetical protein